MQKVSQEVAVEEVQKWLDFKKIKDAAREENKSGIQAIVDGIICGQLVLNDDMSLTHKLDFPEDLGVDELVYKARLKVSETHSKLKGVKGTDADGRVLALISALSGKPTAICSRMDTVDYSIAQTIAIFFL